jgi:hypothetical protein
MVTSTSAVSSRGSETTAGAPIETAAGVIAGRRVVPAALLEKQESLPGSGDKNSGDCRRE